MKNITLYADGQLWHYRRVDCRRLGCQGWHMNDPLGEDGPDIWDCVECEHTGEMLNTKESMLNLLKLQKEVIKLDPYDVVKCDLDGFSAYAYIDLPDVLCDEREFNLSQEEDEAFSKWQDELLSRLQDEGLKGWRL